MNISKETNSTEPLNAEQPSTVRRRKEHWSEDEIASRAYSLWQEKGFPEGSAEDDWLQAEHDLESREIRRR